MGNTPTKDKQENLYATYIQQQQELIYKQQNQIYAAIFLLIFYCVSIKRPDLKILSNLLGRIWKKTRGK